MLRIFYKYVNELIDEEKLVKELKNLAKNEKVPEKKEQILDLMYLIKAAMIVYNNSNYELYDAIYELFLNNPLYQELSSDVNSKDLMLLITDYMKVKNPPYVNQQEFDQLVEDAMESLDPKENCLRLALNYELYNLDFSKIEDYLIETRDAWYMAQYVGSIDNYSYNLDNLLLKICSTNDYKYLNNLLNTEPFTNELTLDQIKKLEESIK